MHLDAQLPKVLSTVNWVFMFQCTYFCHTCHVLTPYFIPRKPFHLVPQHNATCHWSPHFLNHLLLAGILLAVAEGKVK